MHKGRTSDVVEGEPCNLSSPDKQKGFRGENPESLSITGTLNRNRTDDLTELQWFYC